MSYYEIRTHFGPDGTVTVHLPMILASSELRIRVESNEVGENDTDEASTLPLCGVIDDPTFVRRS